MIADAGQSEELEALNNVIRTRHTTRKFKGEAPQKAVVDLIVEAGIYAPYAAMTGMKLDELRRIVILTPGSEVKNKVKHLLYGEIKKGSKRLKLMSHFVPKLRNQGHTFIQRLEYFVKNGVPALEQGTYWILVLEKKGIPASSKLAVAHVLQNMWLEATSLELGFQLLSATALLEKSPAFWETIGYPKGLYELDGCLVGLAATGQAARSMKTIPAEGFVKWF